MVGSTQFQTVVAHAVALASRLIWAMFSISTRYAVPYIHPVVFTMLRQSIVTSFFFHVCVFHDRALFKDCLCGLRNRRKEVEVELDRHAEKTTMELEESIPPLSHPEGTSVNIDVGNVQKKPIFFKRSMFWLRRSDVPAVIAFAFSGGLINQLSYAYALLHTTAISSAVMRPLVPVFTLLLNIILRKEEPSLVKALAVVISVCGAIIMVEPWSFTVHGENLGNIILIFASMNSAVLLTSQKAVVSRIPIYVAMFYGNFIGGMFVSLASLFFWHTIDFDEIPGLAWISLLYCAIGGGIIGYICAGIALRHLDASTVAVYGTFQPFFVGVLGWFLLSERLTMAHLLGFPFTFCGTLVTVYLSFKKKRGGAVVKRIAALEEFIGDDNEVDLSSATSGSELSSDESEA